MAELNNGTLKTLDVLDLLGQARGPLHLRDIALRLEQPESTIHRLLASLAVRGYVRQVESNGPYVLGWKIAVLARALNADLRLIEELQPHLEQLVRRVRQPVNLGVLSNTRVMYLECIPPSNSISLYVPPGLLVPAHATALGKSLLAHLPLAELHAILGDLQLDPLTPHTITSVVDLEAALEVVRQRGFAVDEGEYV